MGEIRELYCFTHDEVLSGTTKLNIHIDEGQGTHHVGKLWHVWKD